MPWSYLGGPQLVPREPSSLSYLGGPQLVPREPGLVQDPAGDLTVVEFRLPEQVGGQRPEMVHKVGVGSLGGEPGAADPDGLEDT